MNTAPIRPGTGRTNTPAWLGDLTRNVKQAAETIKSAAAQMPDDMQIEQAFADQAYQAVANKAGVLMKDPHRLGFEVVWKNDTATRLVGIFAFRVNRQLYYTPVFFLRGDICGTDLLYQVSKGLFTTLDPENTAFIVARDTQTQTLGKGVPMAQTRAIQPIVRLDRMAFPPNMQAGSSVKYASSTYREPELTLAQAKALREQDGQRWGGYQGEKWETAKTASAENKKNESYFYDGAAVNPGIRQMDAIARKGDTQTENPVKTASLFDEAFPQAKDWGALFDAMCMPADEMATKCAAQGHPLLDEFIAEPKLTDMFLQCLEGSTKFANALSTAGFDIATLGDRLAPLILANETSQVKKAAEKPAGHVVSLITGVQDKESWTAEEMTKMASSGGWMLEDSRNPEDCTRVWDTTEGDIAFKKASDFIDADGKTEQNRASDEILSMDTPGEYSILRADKQFQNGLFLTRASDFDWWGGEVCSEGYSRRNSSFELCRSATLVRWDDGSVTTKHPYESSNTQINAPMGFWLGNVDYDKAPFTKTPKAGKTYIAVLKGAGALGNAVLIMAVKNRDDSVAEIHLTDSSYGKNGWRVLQNQDSADSDLDNRMFGSDLVWLEVANSKEKRDEPVNACAPCGSDVTDGRRVTFSKEVPEWRVKTGPVIGNQKTLGDVLSESPEKLQLAVQVKSAGLMEFTFTGPADKPLGVVEMGRNRAIEMLARGMGIHGDMVHGMIKQASANRLSYLLVGKPEQQLVKMAAAYARMDRRPPFTETSEPDFGLTVRYPETFMMPADTQAIPPPQSRYGDAFMPNRGVKNEDAAESVIQGGKIITTQELETLAPEELQELAQTRQVPKVFETGAISSMLHLEDAMGYIGKYLPKLEEGTDFVGRMQFMLYWKPEDFERAIGKQDMESMENELTSNWKSLGRLNLSMQKRIRLSSDNSAISGKSEDA